MQKVSFHFKSNKEVAIAPDAAAAFTASGWKLSDKGKGWKRPSVEVELPSVDQNDVISILEAGGVGVQFLLAVTNEQFSMSARSKLADIISANPMTNITSESILKFDLSWESMATEFLAALQETRSTGIAKEVWDDFEADYVAVMAVQMPANGVEKTANAAAHLKARYQKCRSNKLMVKKLQDYLAVWFAASSNQEDFVKVFDALNTRAEILINAQDEDSI